MSLKNFHIVFVALSSLLALVFGAWSLSRGAEAGGGALTGIVSWLLAATLIVYGVWFYRKIRTREEEQRRRRDLLKPVSAVAVVALMAIRDAAACSVCYGEAEGPLIDAARMGVWLLFGLVICVQGSFATFFIVLWKRSRQHRDN